MRRLPRSCSLLYIPLRRPLPCKLKIVPSSANRPPGHSIGHCHWALVQLLFSLVCVQLTLGLSPSVPATSIAAPQLYFTRKVRFTLATHPTTNRSPRWSTPRITRHLILPPTSFTRPITALKTLVTPVSTLPIPIYIYIMYIALDGPSSADPDPSHISSCMSSDPVLYATSLLQKAEQVAHVNAVPSSRDRP
jgi:hypothetical protein